MSSSLRSLCLSVRMYVYVYMSVLYHYTINKDYTWYYICSAWFLDIIISTCFCLATERLPVVIGNIIPSSVVWP